MADIFSARSTCHAPKVSQDLKRARGSRKPFSSTPARAVSIRTSMSGGATADVPYLAHNCPRRVATMFGVLAWIVFGVIVGAIAKLLMPGRDPGGFIVTMLLGIAGALVGGFLGRAAGWYGPNDAAGFLMSLFGAVVLLLLYRMIIGRRSTI